ncbi:MAG: ZIP family metal transporter [Lachnospiraceae bacterium]|nr:ZIP family metal transporter [Lachnospiraceae bacterium]
MKFDVILGLIIPFIGTAAGAGCVFFMRRELKDKVQRALTGFASGVMVAASIWSLIIPALDQSESYGKFSFVPAVVGFWIGILFLLLLDTIIPHLHMNTDEAEGLQGIKIVEGIKKSKNTEIATKLKKTTMMVLAVTLHNIPEGMAVGVVYAGYISGNSSITKGGALALAIGIAIQNFPEGAIISMPLHANGESKLKAFGDGVFSGAVEPVGALITIGAAGLILPFMPYLLSFAAGAMMYVVVEELIPEMSAGEHSNIGVIMFSVGFTLMMILDVALG